MEEHDALKLFSTKRLNNDNQPYNKLSAELFFLENGGNILDFSAWWNGVKRCQFEKLSAELYFLKNGGNIFDFPDWWNNVCKSSKWGFELDAIDAYYNVPINVKKPDVIVVVSPRECAHQIFNWSEMSKSTQLPVERKRKANVAGSKLQILKRMCCINGCQEVCSLHSFPSTFKNGVVSSENVGRCKVWIEFSKNKKSCELPLHSLHNNYFICSSHFDDKQYYDSSRIRLLPNAVPSLNNPDTGENTDEPAEQPATCSEFIQMNHEKQIESKGANKRSCCFSGCDPSDKSISLHTFPKIIINGVMCCQSVERCKTWVQLSGNKDLLKISTVSLHKKYFVCGRHFDTGQYFNASRKRLLPNAVPNIDCHYPLSHADMKLFPVLGHRNDVHADSQENTIIDHVIEAVQQRYNLCLTEDLLKDKYYKEFSQDMKNLDWYHCPDCKESFMCKRKLKKPCLHTKNCEKFSMNNDMDPGEIPDELKGLTFLEEQLIARVHPLISVFKIKGHQYAYSGNVINFSQDVNELAKKLPHRIDDLKTVLTVRTQECQSPKEFHVNANKVKTALQWLKNNNPFYHDIEICDYNLSLLPEDKNMFDDLPNTIICDELSQQTNNTTNPFSDDNEMAYTTDNEDDPPSQNDATSQNTNKLESSHLEDSGIPVTLNTNQDNQLNAVIDWPTISKQPLSEFKTIGYIVMAFPTLFPFGKCDLNSLDRQKPVTATQYFQHLFRYNDRRFQQHPRFRYFAMNTLIRRHSIENGNIYVRRKDEMQNMTIEELKDKLKENPRYMDNLMYQCANIQGTKAYWKARCQELLQMIEQLGMPTLFSH